MGYMAEDINGGTIVVKVNYRTGLLANLGGKNLGLDDAKKALTFIQTHIQKFGGDPNKITLIGDGFGAVTAAALATIYPDWVKGVVLQSGSFGSPWAYIRDPSVAMECVLDLVYGAESLDDLKDVELSLIMGTTVGCAAYPLGFYWMGLWEAPKSYRIGP